MDCVDDIELETKSIYSQLNLKDKKILLSKLKKNIIIKLKQHIKESQNKYKLVDLNVDNPICNTVFSFYDNSFFYFLKFLFKNGLSSLYNKLYICSQKLNFTYTDFCLLSPAEVDLLIAIYKKNNSIK